jgi:hypothetical protein
VQPSSVQPRTLFDDVVEGRSASAVVADVLRETILRGAVAEG